MTLRSSFLNSGQVCLCGSRIYVQQDIYGNFMDRFVQATKNLKVGDPKSPDTFMGPVVSKEHKQKIWYPTLACLLLLIFAIPIYASFLFASGSLRFSKISIFATDAPFSLFIINFIKHLSPNFLFFHGTTHPRYGIPYTGQYLYIILPFVLFGIVALWKKSKKI